MQYLYKKTSDRQTSDTRIQVWTGDTYEMRITLGKWDTKVHIWTASGVEYTPDILAVSVRGNAKNIPLQMDIHSGRKTVLLEEVSLVRDRWEHQLEIIKGIQKIFIDPLNNGTFDFESNEVSCSLPATPAKYLVILNRTRQDGLNVERYASIYVISPPNWMDTGNDPHWLQLLRGVALKFLNTPEGKQAWKDTCCDFNWGDIDTYISDKFLSQHGIETYCSVGSLEISGVITLEVNQDESFSGPEEDT